MALELLAAIVAAIAMAGVAHLARRLSGGRLPRWTVPGAAAVGLIGFTVWNEYDWFGRVSAELPPGVPVVWSETGADGLRPWTHLVPLTTRFIALDTRNMARHPGNPDLRLAHVYEFARWSPQRDTMIVFDCAGDRRITLTDKVTIDDQGVLSGADWAVAGTEDALQKQACEKE
jgi:hypothetical protein